MEAEFKLWPQTHGVVVPPFNYYKKYAYRSRGNSGVHESHGTIKRLTLVTESHTDIRMRISLSSMAF